MNMFIVRFATKDDDGEWSGMYPVCVVLQAPSEAVARKKAKAGLARSSILFTSPDDYHIKSVSIDAATAVVVMNVAED